MGDDDDARDVDGEHWYRVGPKGSNGAARELAESACARLITCVMRLTGSEPLGMVVAPSGMVRAQLYAEYAQLIGSLLLPVAGTLSAGMVERPELVPVRSPGDHLDFSGVHPTWYAVLPGVDYMPGLAEAFAAREVLRDMLCACLPRGPLAVVPTACEDGHGVVRFDLTPSDADRLAVLLEYVCDLLARGRGGAS